MTVAHDNIPQDWMPKGLAAPVIILDHPQLGENIGKCARAMLNCGLTELRLVAPRDGWPNPTASPAASGADTIIDNASVYETLEDAMADCHFVLATTARPRDMIKQLYTPKDAVQTLLKRQRQGERTAILFGGERAGLDNDAIARAHGIVTFPLNPGFASLNLAQAVLLICYSYMEAWQEGHNQNEQTELQMGGTEKAKQEAIQNYIARMTDLLDQRGYFRSADMRPHLIRSLKNIFTRMEITEQELQTLQGLLTAFVREN